MKTYNTWKVEKYYSELNLEEIKAYSGEAEGFSKDVGSIQITGGEPFLRDDLPEIVGGDTLTSPEWQILDSN